MTTSLSPMNKYTGKEILQMLHNLFFSLKGNVYLTLLSMHMSYFVPFEETNGKVIKIQDCFK